MDNVLVSARMSGAKKERAGGILASIGATTSDLINSAFDYVISEKRLPASDSSSERSREGFADFMRASTLDVAWPDTSDDYKELMKQGRVEDYESLA